MKEIQQATLCYLIKKDHGKITDVCLALKKRGFGEGHWNGVGGKVEPGEDLIQAMRREAGEEIGVEILLYKQVAIIDFHFPHNADWNQTVHVFFSDHWQGEPVESDEVRPAWFSVSELDYTTMWPDDIYWLPRVLNGELIKAKFSMGEDQSILRQKVEAVKKL